MLARRVAFGWMIGIGGATGKISKEHLEALETVHFRLNFGLNIAMGLDFLGRFIWKMFRGK